MNPICEKINSEPIPINLEDQPYSPTDAPDDIDDDDDEQVNVLTPDVDDDDEPSFNNCSDFKNLPIVTQISILQDQVDILEKLISQPQIISLSGIQNLKIELTQHWKNKVYNLFYEARIPLFWILDILPDEDDPVDPNIIYVYFINYQVKNKVQNTLEHHLQTVHDNKVFIM